MSGGVDSSVAALLLRDRGFDVIGVTLHLWEPDEGSAAPSRCCAPEDIEDARRTAGRLGLPFFTFDRQQAFAQGVVDPFVDAYLGGTTPSPCVACNRDVKIGAFVELARRLGAVGFATGHYARTGAFDDEAGRPALLRGTDRAKDQSYFLHGIGATALSMLATPLGALDKPAVRAIAHAHGLPNAGKPDSEDLCFTAGDHAVFVERRARDRVRPGPIVDGEGRVVGRHDGVHRFTVGQRKGLGVALGKPAFVAAIDAERGVVRLGSAVDVESTGALVAGVTWLDGALSDGGPHEVTARIRYRHEGTPARVTAREGGAEVRFSAPARAVTPGQVCVFYEGDRVLGGGTIASALPAGTEA
ncbi:MAG: tRNA 2-thiouridine(34) synthase MnmA [Deltaproteobacteria bacterium]|nr:tRNA 2-thiouridine(34) synthase MnmA [Deltaproteobacteria bacterium]